MGERLGWEDGMSDAIQGCPPRSDSEDYRWGYDYIDSSSYYYPEATEPEYPDETEWICGAHGHDYYGDDSEGGRCYCGAKRYPRGGPN